MIHDDPDIDLDDLTRDQLADRPDQPWADLASALDEWTSRQHGIYSSSHGVGLLLDLLTERGLSVIRDEVVPQRPVIRNTTAEADLHRQRTGHAVNVVNGEWACTECWADEDD